MLSHEKYDSFLNRIKSYSEVIEVFRHMALDVHCCLALGPVCTLVERHTGQSMRLRQKPLERAFMSCCPVTSALQYVHHSEGAESPTESAEVLSTAVSG